jgi:hypothetical protein
MEIDGIFETLSLHIKQSRFNPWNYRRISCFSAFTGVNEWPASWEIYMVLMI